MPKKRILTDFKLDKIAAVDTPAQEGALMTIMKRADDNAELVDQIMKGFGADLMEGPRQFSELLQEEMAQETYYEEKKQLQPELGALYDSLCSIAGTSGDAVSKQNSMRTSVEGFMAAVNAKLNGAETAKVAKAVEAAISKQTTKGEEPMSDELKTQLADLEKKLSDQAAEMEVLKSAKADAEVLAKMSDKEKAYMDGMSDEDKKKFLAMDKEQRMKAMSKAAAADEVLEIAGQSISKSAVGDAQFAIMKAQQEHLAELEKDAKANRESLAIAKAEALAKDRYAHVPGTDVEKGAMLRAMDNMDEAVRKSFQTVLDAHQEMVKQGFDRVGHQGGTGAPSGDINKARQDFETKVAEIAKRDSLARNEAMSKARKEFPDLFASYQGN